jgi:hypothetical protein
MSPPGEHLLVPIEAFRDWIMVAAGLELRARVTRSESQANTFFGVFILVAAGVRGASASCEVRDASKNLCYGLDTSSGGVRAAGSGRRVRSVPVAASRQVPSAWEYSCLGFDFGSGGVRVVRLVHQVRAGRCGLQGTRLVLVVG